MVVNANEKRGPPKGLDLDPDLDPELDPDLDPE